VSKTTWADVAKGDTVELGGREYRVVRVKRKGKKVDVSVEAKGRYAASFVKAKDRVKVVRTAADAKKLTGPQGEQTRWAKKSELRESMGVELERGNPKQTKPPAPAEGGLWDTPETRVEKRLDQLLGARLVGETSDPSAGYYVPPVDVSTVAGHLAIFHGGIPAACEDEAAMLAAHEAQHAGAKKGEAPLAVNHWHTEKRP
jgi:hypothetical protein